MSFKKISYNIGEEIFKVRIEDTTGALIDNWVFMKRDFDNWVHIIKKKHGISNNRKIDRDLDWAI